MYDQYAAELSKIGDQQTALTREYADQWGTMTDEQASSLAAKRSLGVDEQIAQLRVKYMPVFSQVVPGQVVATFFQPDRRFQALLDIHLASQIPLVQDQNQAITIGLHPNPASFLREIRQESQHCQGQAGPQGKATEVSLYSHANFYRGL